MNPVTEQELKEAAVAPRVTPEYMESRIAKADFLVKDTLTICVITLDNGYQVIGEAACVKTENFNEDIGQRISRQNAFNKLWPLFGFVLAETGGLK